VCFLRIGERRITATGRGIVCYISNYSYIDDPSFVVARQRLSAEFDTIWIDCMNGDSRETGKLTPDGRPDPSIFSTPFNRVVCPPTDNACPRAPRFFLRPGVREPRGPRGSLDYAIS
jgi:hypothetical protein